jgi:hypothetical protein
LWNTLITFQMLWNTLIIFLLLWNTLIIFNTYYFSTASMVKRTRLNVTLAVAHLVFVSRRQTPRIINATLLSNASSDDWRPSANHDALRVIPRQWMRDLWCTNQNQRKYRFDCFGSTFSFISPTTLHSKPQRHSFSPSKQNTRRTHAHSQAHTHTYSHKHLAVIFVTSLGKWLPAVRLQI